MSLSAPLIILGGRSLVAPYLMKQLAYLGRGGKVLSRRLSTILPSGFSSLPFDLEQPFVWDAQQGSVVISLLPIWILVAGLPHFKHVKSIIAVSSTSRFSKTQSDDPAERYLAEKLTGSEQKLHEWGKAHKVDITILRPTLIYDGVTDNNITRIMTFVRRFWVLPVAAPAKGLRQPIHADDVAKAIIAAIKTPACANKSFNIAGGEVLTYRQMVERIFEFVGRKPRLLMLSTGFLRGVARLLLWLKVLDHRNVGFAMFNRMNQDLVFDVAEGVRLMKLSPRKFDLH